MKEKKVYGKQGTRMQSHLVFNAGIGRQKPENIINRGAACPFCDRDGLEGIIEQRGPIILLPNKYPVLEDTFPTVLIETDDCNGELSTYPRRHLHELIRFGVEKWLEMEESGEFRSVIFFKNHGPLSGGTIRHPHMQIIGLRSYDYRQNIKREDFVGILIDRQPGVECNLSTKPRVGFFEYNVILHDRDKLAQMADYLQMLAHYLLNHRNCSSYNLFFYRLDGQILAKVVPRYVTSPLFIGFSIPQVSNILEEVVAEIQERYLSPLKK
jgi:galactose-1-phosphate uridylyltransferase